MPDEERIEQLELEVKVLRANNKGLKDKIDEQSKEIEELKEERKKYPIAMNDEQYKKVIELAQKDIKEELDRQIDVRMISEEYIEKNYISKEESEQKERKAYIKGTNDAHELCNKMWKDKIKAKIEYKKDKLKQIQNSNDRYRIMCLQVEIDILQSLLEKE